MKQILCKFDKNHMKKTFNSSGETVYVCDKIKPLGAIFEPGHTRERLVYEDALMKRTVRKKIKNPNYDKPIFI